MDAKRADKLLTRYLMNELDDATRAEFEALVQKDAALRERLGDRRVALNLIHQAVAATEPTELSAERRVALAKLAGGRRRRERARRPRRARRRSFKVELGEFRWTGPRVAAVVVAGAAALLMVSLTMPLMKSASAPPAAMIDATDDVYAEELNGLAYVGDAAEPRGPRSARHEEREESARERGGAVNRLSARDWNGDGAGRTSGGVPGQLTWDFYDQDHLSYSTIDMFHSDADYDGAAGESRGRVSVTDNRTAELSERVRDGGVTGNALIDSSEGAGPGVAGIKGKIDVSHGVGARITNGGMLDVSKANLAAPVGVGSVLGVEGTSGELNAPTVARPTEVTAGNGSTVALGAGGALDVTGERLGMKAPVVAREEEKGMDSSFFQTDPAEHAAKSSQFDFMHQHNRDSLYRFDFDDKLNANGNRPRIRTLINGPSPTFTLLPSLWEPPTSSGSVDELSGDDGAQARSVAGGRPGVVTAPQSSVALADEMSIVEEHESSSSRGDGAADTPVAAESQRRDVRSDAMYFYRLQPADKDQPKRMLTNPDPSVPPARPGPSSDHVYSSDTTAGVMIGGAFSGPAPRAADRLSGPVVRGNAPGMATPPDGLSQRGTALFRLNEKGAADVEATLGDLADSDSGLGGDTTSDLTVVTGTGVAAFDPEVRGKSAARAPGDFADSDARRMESAGYVGRAAESGQKALAPSDEMRSIKPAERRASVHTAGRLGTTVHSGRIFDHVISEGEGSDRVHARISLDIANREGVEEERSVGFGASVHSGPQSAAPAAVPELPVLGDLPMVGATFGGFATEVDSRFLLNGVPQEISREKQGTAEEAGKLNRESDVEEAGLPRRDAVDDFVWRREELKLAGQEPADKRESEESLGLSRDDKSVDGRPSRTLLFSGTTSVDQVDDTALPTAASFVAGPVNPWELTRRDRFSTFATDVDTASYTLGRAFIRRGYRPPPASVRMEEYINAFDYNYPKRSLGTFNIHTETAASPFRGELTLLKIGVKGKVVGRDDRQPAHLVLVVDASGSMERDDRMPLIQQALKLMVSRLDRRDRVSLVTYGTDSRLILESTPMTEAARIVEAVDAMQCGGSTNMLEGLRLGYEIAGRSYQANATNQVLLLSDGVANVGEVDAEALVKQVAAFREQGITFTAAGFGMGRYNDALLETLANRGDGQYVFIDSAAETQRVFGDELSARINIIARDAKIQVEFDPKVARRYRLIGYENRAVADRDFRNDQVDAGEVGSGQSVTALYELELFEAAAVERAGRRALGTVFVRYRDVATNEVQEIARTVEPSYGGEPTPRFVLAACAAQFAEMLRGSEHAGDVSIEQVRRKLDPVAHALPLDSQIKELLELTRAVDGLPAAP